MIDQFITTFLARPYVFAFLAAFLFLAWRRFGWRRTMVWLVTGYLIAWASEVSSIHNGFPYGLYKYVYESMPGELMIAGVPFFDSLSYAFLSYAGFAVASFFVGNLCTDTAATPRRCAPLVLLASFFTMLIDVVVDPVATMGDRWFLGQIHYYVYPGFYFGVPLTNFGGWFLVALAIVACNALLWRLAPAFFAPRERLPQLRILDPIFYLSIGLFQTTVAFWIGEPRLGMVNMIILTTVTLALVVRTGVTSQDTTS